MGTQLIVITHLIYILEFNDLSHKIAPKDSKSHEKLALC